MRVISSSNLGCLGTTCLVCTLCISLLFPKSVLLFHLDKQSRPSSPRVLAFELHIVPYLRVFPSSIALMNENLDSEKPSNGIAPTNPVPTKEVSPEISTSGSENGSSTAVEKAWEPAQPEQSPRNIHGVKWVLAVTSVLASTFLFALDNTIVADVQPAIVERFGDVGKLPWLSVAFLVAAAGTNLVWYSRHTPTILCSNALTSPS